jgi:hypothetical protein
MTRTRNAWILAVAALLPVAACTVDRNDEEELPEAENSRMPDYEVTLPDVDVDLDSATIPVPDIDIEQPGEIERTDR